MTDTLGSHAATTQARDQGWRRKDENNLNDLIPIHRANTRLLSSLGAGAIERWREERQQQEPSTMENGYRRFRQDATIFTGVVD